MLEQTATEEKNGGAVSAGRMVTLPKYNAAQENLTLCQHPGHVCISQNGRTCTHGQKCEPMDEHGRRFVIREWIEDEQRFVSRTYVAAKIKQEPIIDAEQANEALATVAMLKPVRGRC